MRDQPDGYLLYPIIRWYQRARNCGIIGTKPKNSSTMCNL